MKFFVEASRMSCMICGSDKGTETEGLTDKLVVSYFHMVVFPWCA